MKQFDKTPFFEREDGVFVLEVVKGVAVAFGG